MEKPKMSRQKVAFIAVTIALVLCVAYIAFSEYQKMRDQEQLSAYQLGAQYGYQQAVLQLMQQVSTCNQVPVMYENQTINVIAVACLQTAQGGQ
jgi:hypothetical protein